MNRLYLILIILIFGNYFSEAKTPFDSTYSNVLGNSLINLNLSPSDILIPKDLRGDVRYLHPSIKELFDNPLQSANFADDVVNILTESNTSLNSTVFSKLNKINHFKNFRAVEFDDFLANDILNKYLGLDLDSAFGFPASLIVKQYLIPILKANLNLEKDNLFSNINEIRFIKKYADSVFFREDININNPYLFNEFQKHISNITDNFFQFADLSSNSNIYNTGLSLYLHYLKLNQLTISNLDALSLQIQTKIVETNIGKIAIGGTSDDKFSGNFVLIIDLGGNDTYELPDFPKTLSLLTPVRCIVDFAGNDTYHGGNYTLGGAYFGINLQYDYLGDDNYSANHTTLGAANFGVGILHDFAGNDSYKSRNLSQGASAFGIGILNDDAGTDTYYSESFSQGFAFTKGIGILIDKIGNDKYISKGKYSNHFGLADTPLSFSQGASLGYSPFAAGGFGFLIDLSGTDSYTADSFSQGAAYFYGYGALCDKTGNDSYISNSFSQGCGLEFGFGNLIDYAGNELYNAKSYSQAYGSDFGSGNLIDFGGDDKYANLSINPDHTAGNSISFFVDYSGKNIFSSEPKSSNQSASNPIDLLFNYADIKLIGTIDSLNSQFSHFADMNFHGRADFRLTLPADISSKKPAKEDDSFIFPNSADSLFVLASSNLNNYRKYASESRDSLATKGFAALEILLDNVNSENPQCTRTVHYVMDKILETNGESTKSYILDSLNSKSHK